MAVPFLGFGAYLGVGAESVYGTAVARTRWTRFISDSLQSNVQNEVQADLSAEIDTMAPLLHYQSAEIAGGSVEFYGNYNDYVLSTFLKHAFGAVTDAGGPNYTHTYVPAKDLPAGLTIERGYRDVMNVYEGCKINVLELKWEIGKPLVVRAEIIAEVGAADAGVSSPTFVTASQSLHNEVGTLLWNSLTSTIKSLTFRLDNKLGRRPQLGSQYTAEPARTANTDIFLEIEQEKTVSSYRTGFTARTQSNAVISITKAASAAIAITLHNALIETYEDNAKDVGPIMERMTFRAFRDASNKGCSLVLTNTNAATI